MRPLNDLHLLLASAPASSSSSVSPSSSGGKEDVSSATASAPASSAHACSRRNGVPRHSAEEHPWHHPSVGRQHRLRDRIKQYEGDLAALRKEVASLSKELQAGRRQSASVQTDFEGLASQRSVSKEKEQYLSGRGLWRER
ncbi:hypothetical protein KFL_003400100 [Klebsormidium nitens]|uniref:Uncharacterized protein n=1 Tax=Klebsormidium nitens TaxID=105231 RepID=A0A1Y1IEV4_KLENI|nr:hypothetical protein KFL_003400100 [Klebsormidium nitens]|eukprot:GAQ87237.1 hypothetical protein KFL_003400100 [Klebsormidium nitens]